MASRNPHLAFDDKDNLSMTASTADSTANPKPIRVGIGGFNVDSAA
jgi:hypothetical protein